MSAPIYDRVPEYRVIDDADLVCMDDIEDLDEAWEVAAMLDVNNPPDIHRVQRAIVTWEDAPRGDTV